MFGWSRERMIESFDSVEDQIDPVIPHEKRAAVRYYFQMFRELTPTQWRQLIALAEQMLDVFGRDKLATLKDLAINPPRVDEGADGN